MTPIVDYREILENKMKMIGLRLSVEAIPAEVNPLEGTDGSISGFDISEQEEDPTSPLHLEPELIGSIVGMIRDAAVLASKEQDIKNDEKKTVPVWLRIESRGGGEIACYFKLKELDQPSEKLSRLLRGYWTGTSNPHAPDWDTAGFVYILQCYLVGDRFELNDKPRDYSKNKRISWSRTS